MLAPSMIIMVVVVNFNLLAAQGKAFFQPSDRLPKLKALSASVKLAPANVAAMESHRPINRVNDAIGGIHRRL